MYRQAPPWTGWATLMLSVLLILVWAPAIQAYISAESRDDYRDVPSLTAAQFVREQDAVFAIASAKVSDDPRDYYRNAIRAQQFDLLTLKFRKEHSDDWMRLSRGFTGMQIADINAVQVRYEKHHGLLKMATVADQMRPWMDAQLTPIHRNQPPRDYRQALDWLLRGYVASCCAGVLFYMTRLKHHGLLVWPELVNGRLFGASLTGLGLAMVYPSRINPLAQIKRAWQFVGGILAGIISFGAMGGLANASERRGGGDGGNSNVFTLLELPVPKISVSGGTMSAKVTGNGTRVHDGATNWGDVHASFDKGIDLDLWSSKQAAGITSDEIDYTACDTSKVGAATATGCLAYYDIFPLGRSKGGDMISPFVTIENPVGHGVVAFAKADVYFLTHGPPTNNGFDVSAGIKGVTHVGPVDFGHSVSAVYNKGPFGQSSGASVRFDETASVPLSDRLKLIFNLKSFVPFAGAKDRKNDLSGGVGFAYAFD